MYVINTFDRISQGLRCDWYVDDPAGGGHLGDIHHWFGCLHQTSLDFGYFVNPVKCCVVVDGHFLDKAQCIVILVHYKKPLLGLLPTCDGCGLVVFLLFLPMLLFTEKVA